MSLLPDIIDWYGGFLLNSLVMTILSNILRTKVLSQKGKRPSIGCHELVFKGKQSLNNSVLEAFIDKLVPKDEISMYDRSI